MKSAVGTEHSLHYVTVSAQPGHKVRMVCDVGQGKGIQRITVTHHGHTGPAEVIVYKKIVFLKGNALTMRVFFGFSRKQAQKFAGRWIFIRHSNAAFAAIADGATFPTFVASLYPASQLSLVTQGNLIGVHGTAQEAGLTVAETLFAPNHGKALPVKGTASYPGHPGHDHSSLGRWNEAVHVTVPANAIPLQAVTGS